MSLKVEKLILFENAGINVTNQKLMLLMLLMWF